MTEVKWVKRKDPKKALAAVRYSVTKLLEECDGYEFHLKPRTYAKHLKGISMNDPDHELNVLEKKRYRAHLLHILKHYYHEDWKVKESNGQEFKLIFVKEEKL